MTVNFVEDTKAKRKHCPIKPGQAMCNGPDCMLWRYKVKPVSAIPDNMMGRTIYEKEGAFGYCGLAPVAYI